MFLCLRVFVYHHLSRSSQKHLLPPPFLAFVFTVGKKLGQHAEEGSEQSALGDRGWGEGCQKQSSSRRGNSSTGPVEGLSGGSSEDWLEFLARGWGGRE